MKYLIQEEFLQYCYQNNLQAIQLFLKNNSIDSDFLQKGLKTVVQEKFFSIALFFMKNGASLEIEAPKIAEFAIRQNNFQIIHFLYKNSIQIPLPINSIFESINDEKFFFATLKICTNIEEFYDDILIQGALKGKFKIVKWALEQGANIHAKEDSAITLCTQNFANLELLKFLVQKGANMHERNEYLLQKSAYHNQVDILHYLLQNNCDIYANNGKAFFNTIEQKSKECFDILLNHNIDISFQNYEAFILCIKKNRFSMLEKLLIANQGKPINNFDVLKTAIDFNSVDMLKLLLTSLNWSISEEIMNYAIQKENPTIIQLISSKKTLQTLQNELDLKIFKKNMKI